jgi:hypothetical protein
MNNNTTVFVLGAGASYEFGLPIGEQLKDHITKLLNFDHNGLNGDDYVSRAINIAAHLDKTLDRNLCIQAAQGVKRALPLALSIDNFIHSNRDDKYVEMCGKLGITRAILHAEFQSKLFCKDTENGIDFATNSKTWLVKLMQLLSEQCTLQELEERLSTITFIVFNYDRCLEHFLMHAIATSYRISSDKAAEIVRQIAIFHPYGTVGKLPWMRSHTDEVIEFGGMPDVNLYKLSQGIKTFTEGTDAADSDILAIRKAMYEAKRVIFLGYSYHPLNMKLLVDGNPEKKTTRQVFGTSYGMSASDTDNIQNTLDSLLFAPSVIVRNDLTCLSLFQEYSRSIGFN